MANEDIVNPVKMRVGSLRIRLGLPASNSTEKFQYTKTMNFKQIVNFNRLEIWDHMTDKVIIIMNFWRIHLNLLAPPHRIPYFYHYWWKRTLFVKLFYTIIVIYDKYNYILTLTTHRILVNHLKLKPKH